jgi:hypothetical protein
MRHRFFPAVIVLVLTGIACGVSAPPAAPPTVMPLPPTPAFLPTQAPAPLPATQAPAPAATDFTGTWKGPDPDDGSAMILTLVQSGNTLEGRYSDSYSTTIAPPGYEGTVTGSVLSPTSAQVTMQLSRHDGKNLLLQANLAMADPNTVTATITSASASPWVLTRQ